VLRKATEDVLPRKIAWRRSKLGYPTPMARWFRKPTEKKDVEDILFSSQLARRGFVRPDVLHHIWSQHQAGQDHSWLLYRVVTTELWCRHFLDDFAPAPASRAA
jgi:asparagine synthase (glutamine-hydrolysing)